MSSGKDYVASGQGQVACKRPAARKDPVDTSLWHNRREQGVVGQCLRRSTRTCKGALPCVAAAHGQVGANVRRAMLVAT
eukprot:7593242-Alexandrium_andersonii.AAC.1